MAYCYLGARTTPGTRGCGSPFCEKHEIISAFNGAHTAFNGCHHKARSKARGEGNGIFAGATVALLLGIFLVAMSILSAT